MILLATACARASECAKLMNEGCGMSVEVADSLARATTMLRVTSYRVVVLDQSLLDTEPDQASRLLEHLDSAVLAPINFALCAKERLVREVRAALKRQEREVAAIRKTTIGRLRGELNDTITALLLSVDMALHSMPGEAGGQLRGIRELVATLGRQIELGSATR